MEGQVCRELWQGDRELSHSMEDPTQTHCGHGHEEAKTEERSEDPSEKMAKDKCPDSHANMQRQVLREIPRLSAIVVHRQYMSLLCLSQQ